MSEIDDIISDTDKLCDELAILGKTKLLRPIDRTIIEKLWTISVYLSQIAFNLKTNTELLKVKKD